MSNVRLVMIRISLCLAVVLSMATSYDKLAAIAFFVLVVLNAFISMFNI